MRIVNISGKKLEIAGHRLCAGHAMILKENEDVSEYIKRGLIMEEK